ncbi:TIGR01777 family oxidoreductase [Pelagicoccus sp. SDUM812003]|uniref:TIGR01777 family oxidoreductase n=1 Tax=Pelagicoccus sp. SDUM812003 TaxID=3041267 RepID=UPI00280C5202|nr:TIGR01777 family oxidoreductase [Pelagicoccus sp. SDUM812003]MDQ8202081.1 TIGR01777 family oxidoreductase [Pelagicoccus sp. SDUM812003]
MKRIVIAGGNGFLGQTLTRYFNSKSWEVSILTRQPLSLPFPAKQVKWDGESMDDWAKELEGADALINLCGKSVNCRYTEANREAILQSRLKSTSVLKKALQAANDPPPVWLNASSGTIYQHSLHTPMDESTGTFGEGFSENVCKAWENECFSDDLPRTRRIAMRTSMVLGDGDNSVYPVLARLARWGLGGRIGAGKQLVSWIHELDFARAVTFLIEDHQIEGPVNITAPAPAPNSVFMSTLRNSLGSHFGLVHYRPILEAGAFLLRTESELVLKSRYVLPEILLKRRFVFAFPFLDEALSDLRDSPSFSLQPCPAKDPIANA